MALTSDTTAKNLPKDDSKDHIVQFKGGGRGGGERGGGEGGTANDSISICSMNGLNLMQNVMCKYVLVSVMFLTCFTLYNVCLVGKVFSLFRAGIEDSFTVNVYFSSWPRPSGWPRLVWCLTEHLPKPPKDWTPPQRPQPENDCYAEMTMSKDGSAALGATVTRQGLIAHCKVLSTACLYKESECPFELQRLGQLGMSTWLSGCVVGMYRQYLPVLRCCPWQTVWGSYGAVLCDELHTT